MTRRVFTEKILTAVSGLSLIDALFTFEAIGRPIKPILDHWAI